ncbi:MAG: flavodoxin domain-containing protein [Bacillus sp. (in: firmicutes)]
MNTLIVYASKNGTTEKCVERLASLLENTYVVNLEESLPNTLDFDTIIIGGSIHYGTLNKSVRTFLDHNLQILLTKKVGLFLCCGMAEDVEKHFEANFPKPLLKEAIDIEYFGGEMDLDTLSGLDKLVVKMVMLTNRNLKEHPPEIINANIDRMARNIEELA